MPMVISKDQTLLIIHAEPNIWFCFEYIIQCILFFFRFEDKCGRNPNPKHDRNPK